MHSPVCSRVFSAAAWPTATQIHTQDAGPDCALTGSRNHGQWPLSRPAEDVAGLFPWWGGGETGHWNPGVYFHHDKQYSPSELQSQEILFPTTSHEVHSHRQYKPLLNIPGCMSVRGLLPGEAFRNTGRPSAWRGGSRLFRLC